MSVPEKPAAGVIVTILVLRSIETVALAGAPRGVGIAGTPAVL